MLILFLLILQCHVCSYLHSISTEMLIVNCKSVVWSKLLFLNSDSSYELKCHLVCTIMDKNHHGTCKTVNQSEIINQQELVTAMVTWYSWTSNAVWCSGLIGRLEAITLRSKNMGIWIMIIGHSLKIGIDVVTKSPSHQTCTWGSSFYDNDALHAQMINDEWVNIRLKIYDKITSSTRIYTLVT